MLIKFNSSILKVNIIKNKMIWIKCYNIGSCIIINNTKKQFLLKIIFSNLSTFEPKENNHNFFNIKYNSSKYNFKIFYYITIMKNYRNVILIYLS